MFVDCLKGQSDRWSVACGWGVFCYGDKRTKSSLKSPGNWLLDCHHGGLAICLMKMFHLLCDAGDLCLSLSSHPHLSLCLLTFPHQINFCSPRRKICKKCFSADGQFNCHRLIPIQNSLSSPPNINRWLLNYLIRRGGHGSLQGFGFS